MRHTGSQAAVANAGVVIALHSLQVEFASSVRHIGRLIGQLHTVYQPCEYRTVPLSFLTRHITQENNRGLWRLL